MKRWIWILAIGLLVLTSCIARTTYSVVTPTYPHLYWFYPTTPRQIDSLQPTFRWKPATELPNPEVSYDLVLYEDDNIVHTDQQLLEKSVYYRQGLKETEHKIEAALKPNTRYYWSVRVRQGEKISGWASYNHWSVLLTPIGEGYKKAKNNPFSFKTPEK